MKIAVLGTGTVGRTFAEKLVSLGHEVVMGTRDVKAKLSGDVNGNPSAFGAWHQQNSGVKLLAFAEAAAFGEMVINATQGISSLAALKLAGESALNNKVLLDLSNPLDFSQGMPPSLLPSLSNTNSLGEEIQRTFPGCRVVKAMNTMWCGLMVDPAKINGGEHTAFICGNEAAAKEQVIKLMQQFGWKAANIMDLGDIAAARGTEAFLPIWLRMYGVMKTGAFNIKVLS